MNKIVKAMGLFVLAAMVVASVVGCDFVEVLTSVSGRVVNVGATFDAEKGSSTDTYWQDTEGMVVVLVDSSGNNVASDVVDSEGRFTFESISNGTYTIKGSTTQGSKTDWVFIPTEIEVTGLFTTLNKDLLAYKPENDEQILLIVNWENTNIDVDGHLVLDDTEYPDDPATPIGIVNYTTDYGPVADPSITLDRDVRILTGTALNGYPVETIRIHRNPFGGDGWMRYYLKSFQYNSSSNTGTNDGVLTGNPDLTYKQRARATVYVMQGSTHMGSFPLPIDSAENTLGVLKIFANYDAGTDETTYTIASFGNSGTTPRSIAGTGAVAVDAIE